MNCCVPIISKNSAMSRPGISREWAYAALSRGRTENRVYAAGRADNRSEEFAPGERREHRLEVRDRLARDLARSDAQPLALDQLGRGRCPGIEL